MKGIILSFFLLFLSDVIAQQPAYFMFAEKKFEGVDIYDLIQDEMGNYIIASDQGLYIHDGYHFEKIDCSEMNSTSVFNFVKSSDGTIYCNNLNQQVFRIVNGKCELFFTLKDLSSDVSLFATKDKELVVTTSNNLFLIDTKGKIKKTVHGNGDLYFGKAFQFSNGSIISHGGNSNSIVILDKNLGISKRSINIDIPNYDFGRSIFNFFQFDNLTYAVDIVAKELYQFNETTFTLKSHQKLMKTDESSRLYIAGNEIWMAQNTYGVTLFNHFQNKSIFNDYFISDVYRDIEGNFLLSTFDQGIIVIPDLKQLDVEPIFKPYNITRIASSDDNQIYFGTTAGELIRYQNNKLTTSIKGSKAIEFIYKWDGTPFLFYDKDGVTILNTSTGKKYIINASLKGATEIGPNKLALALNTGLQIIELNKNKIHPISKLLNERTYAVANDPNANLFYCSASSGLKLIRNDKTIIDILFNNKKVHVICFREYDNTVYASTRKNGVLVLKNGKIIRQIKPKLKTEDLILYKFQIKNKLIYANSQEGMITMEQDGGNIKLINKSFGFNTNRIIDFEIVNNVLWITHKSGVQKLSLKAINKSPIQPTIALKEILANNVIASENQFAHDVNRIKFVLSSRSLKDRDVIKYHYKLIGNNSDWTINQYSENEILYNALSPGEYEFIVKAENQGVFSNSVHYKFVIYPPFWKRFWFISLSILLSILLIGGYFKYRIEQIRKKNKLLNDKQEAEKNLLESQLTALRSQMNPHFIFNSLNAIQDLVLQEDTDNSYDYIVLFAELVRNTLNYSQKDFIPIEKEIDFLNVYLTLEKLRFKEALTFEISHSGASNISVPSLLIQPFIENAILHGLLHKKGSKNIVVKFTFNKDLICEITDNGIGREASKKIKSRKGKNHESFSLSAIDNRLKIFNAQGSNNVYYQIEDLYENDSPIGTKATIKMPFKREF